MKMGNMREINLEECMRVSGGIIIVNGSPPGTPPNPGPDNTALEGASMYLGMNSTTINYTSLYGQGQTLSENPEIVVTGEWDPDGDDDGDGTLNMHEEIVVNAGTERVQVGDDHFALNRGDGTFMLYKVSDWFWNRSGDGYIGTFRPATPGEADTVIASKDETTITATIEGKRAGIGGGAEIVSTERDGVTTYWERVR